jgi:hypothetical protein
MWTPADDDKQACLPHAVATEPPEISTWPVPPVLAGLRELRHGDNVVGKHGYIYYGGLENPPVDDSDEEPAGEDL